MKLLRYLGLLLLAVMFAACTDDAFVDSPHGADPKERIAISVSSEDLFPVQMNSRAIEQLDQQLSAINDLNYKITTPRATYFVYVDQTNQVKVNGARPSQTSGPDGVYMVQGKGIETPQPLLHFGQATSATRIEVIANYGHDLYRQDWQQVVDRTPIGLNTKTCMMYGVGHPAAGAASSHQVDGMPCQLYELNLRRSMAMVTLKMTSVGLNPGVEIMPKKVRLCNVPKSCNLYQLGHGMAGAAADQKGNRLSAELSQPVGYEFVYYGPSLTKDHSVLGAHIGEEGSDKYHKLLLFENMQGTVDRQGHTDHATKYPAGVTDVAGAKANKTCSYIEIEAVYKYTSPETGKVEVSGLIKYRFFLGANAYDDFNVEGNHYYKLTLNLSGFGGLNEDGQVEGGNIVVNQKDLSWRVDTQLQDWGFAKGKYDFDGHYINAQIPVIGDDWYLEGATSDGLVSWLVIKLHATSQEGQDVSWVNPTHDMSKYVLDLSGGTVKIQIQPMKYGDGSLDPGGMFNLHTFKQAKNYRELGIKVRRRSTNELQTVTIRQYAPIPVQVGQEIVFMERFEEYDSPVGGYPWKYNGMDLVHLYDAYGSQYNYHYGKVSKEDVGANACLLAPNEVFQGFDYVTVDREGEGSAAQVCFTKGQDIDGGNLDQGSPANTYALPSDEMLLAMMNYNVLHKDSHGPYEPVHVFDQYWTSTVPAAHHQQTHYYDGTRFQGTLDHSLILTTTDRNQLKRVRAVYTIDWVNPKGPIVY